MVKIASYRVRPLAAQAPKATHPRERKWQSTRAFLLQPGGGWEGHRRTTDLLARGPHAAGGPNLLNACHLWWAGCKGVPGNPKSTTGEAAEIDTNHPSLTQAGTQTSINNAELTARKARTQA